MLASLLVEMAVLETMFSKLEKTSFLKLQPQGNVSQIHSMILEWYLAMPLIQFGSG